MMYLAGFIGYFAGEFIIGGILFSLLGKNVSPSSSENKIFSWIGKISGAIIGVLLFS